MARGIFVIGTDTGVGKTVVAAGIALVLKERGLKIGVMKPVATGCFSVERKLYSHDAIFLFEASENEYPLLSNPIRFKNPLAPSVAGRVENQPVDVKKILWAFRDLEEKYEYLIVEGIGGLLVPFTDNYFVADLVKEFNLPVLIVARAGLGTINHTLLTVEAARKRKLEVRGILLNGRSSDNFSIAEETNPRVVQDLTGIPVIGVLPYLEGVDVETLQFGGLKEAFKKSVKIEVLL